MELSWFAISIISAFIFSLTTLLARIATDKGVSSTLVTFYIFLFATIFLGGYVFVVEKSFVTSTAVLTILIFAGIFSFVGHAMFYNAISNAPNPGYVDAVSSLRIIIVTVAAIFLFNLKPSTIGIVGSVFIVIGAILLSMVS